MYRLGISRVPKVNFLAKRFSSTLQHVKVEEKDRFLWITLNVIREITEAFTSPEFGPNPEKHRGVVLTGEGKSFSAGADLNWMKRMAGYTEAENAEDAAKLSQMFQDLRACPLPVVGRINGSALGGGTGLAACCDITFGLRSSQFGLTEAKIGLIPAVISPFVLEKIGRQNASRYFLTGERFTGETAVRLGLLHESFESLSDLDAALVRLLAELATAGPQAARASKALIREVVKHDPFSQELQQFVVGQIASIRCSPEGKEGIASFLEKRAPNWTK